MSNAALGPEILRCAQDDLGRPLADQTDIPFRCISMIHGGVCSK